MNKPKYYQNYHKHTSLSHRYNKDSALVHSDYFNHIKENLSDVPQIYSTVEHGWQGNYFKIYDDLEKFNKKMDIPIKFIFGVEAYWVMDRFEKDSANNHIILLAKNDNGRKKINRAIYESFKTGYYYKGRMDLDILLSLPKEDVFVTSACVGFWTGYQLPFENEEQHGMVDEVVLKLFNHFDDFYLELQPHDSDLQKNINKHIMTLHEKYNIPIIAGVDSHYINEKQKEDRDDLLRSNGISYDNEEEFYNDFPSCDELIKRFELQNVVPIDKVYEAINNTNKTLEFEDIILDRSLKVPVAKKYKHMTQEERNNIFKDILRREWKEQISDINRDKYDQYIKEINHDIKEIIDSDMADYFIDNYEIMKLGQEKYGGILTPSGRGSAVSMYLNKLLRLTKVDKVNSPVLMYSERFLTSARILESKTPPDVDHNVSQREPFIQAQKDIICEEGTFDLIALGTLHYKSAFKMYARAYNLDPDLSNEVTKQISKYEKDLKYIEEEDDKDLIDIYDYVDKEKYGYLIEGCQEYMGIVDTVKAHPCGTTCYDGDAIEDIGVIMVKAESQGDDAKQTFVAVIESGTIDAFGYLKQDYLIVDSIGLTYDIYKEIGIEPMTVNELLKTIEGDKKTWDIYKDGYTMCVNQAEQPKSTQKVMRFSPKNISETTQWIAGIRPSFKEMYKIFENRQHFEYGIKAFDDLIQDEYCNSSWILYQETLMRVLSFAGFDIGETYNIIKAISKKKKYIIDGAKDKFLPNFASAIIETKETNNIEEANTLSHKVWNIIESSASYGFNSSHAYCMAIDSVTLAWQKAYYPLEFYKVTLQRYTNKGKKDKVSLLKQEMLKRGISLRPIKFGEDNREFSIDRENNCINQTMASIKNMEKITPNVMYEIGLKGYKDFFNILKEIKSHGLTKTSRDILIKLDYFSQFGHPHQLLAQVQVYTELSTIYNKFKDAKKPSKSFFEDLSIPLDEVAQIADKSTEKQFTITDNQALLGIFKRHYKSILKQVSSKYPYQPTTTLDKIKYEVELLGYTDLVDESVNDSYYIVTGIETNQWGTVFLSLYQLSTGYQQTYKVDKKWVVDYKCKIGDILNCFFDVKQCGHYEMSELENKKTWVLDDKYETILKKYSIK